MEQRLMTLSDFLKDKRKRLNLTQQQLAEKRAQDSFLSVTLNREKRHLEWTK